MKSIKILFVDDNSVNLIAAENLMLSLGIHIYKACDGESAIKMATNDDYDMIFMDLMMPNLDGFMTTRLLRNKLNKNNKTKIIATSGINMYDDQEVGLHDLFEDRIEKPLKIVQLQACLERWIDKDQLVQLQTLTKDCSTEGIVDYWNNFLHSMEWVKDIHIDYFLEFDKKDVNYFMRLFKSSIKQLNQAIIIMKDSISSRNDNIAHNQLHALKSVFYYIGAHTLASIAVDLDHKLLEAKGTMKAQRFTEIMPNYQVLIERMTNLCSELEQAIRAYNSNIINYQENLNSSISSIEDMSKHIEQILFHVARYEYIEIFNGLNYLRNITSQEIKSYIDQAISCLEEFEYERVEEILRDCWNEVIRSNMK